MFRRVKRLIVSVLNTPPLRSEIHWVKFLGCEVKGRLNVVGHPYIYRAKGSLIIFEDGVTLQSNAQKNPSGIVHECRLVTMRPNAEIYVGKDAGMSGVTICCSKRVTIGEYVGLGANVSIIDTDFHPINPYLRKYANDENTNSKEIEIGDFAWIGANSMILKGVHIGRGAVVGAGSVVTHDVPEFTIYAGNPAKFVKNVELTKEQYNKIFSR